MQSSSTMVWLGSRLNGLLKPLGLRLSRYPAPADRRRQQLMERAAIDTVIDVGANAGQYGTLLRECGYRGAIRSFEPLPGPFARLRSLAARDGRWSVANAAVSDSTGPMTMHVAGNSVSSSLLPMSERHREAAPASATIGEISVECMTLESVLASTPGRSVMVKIDTQGFELPVLRSAGEAIRGVRLIELEMSLVELYAGQAMFRELDAFLLARGFALRSLEEGFFDAQSGELLQVDAVYANVAVAIG